MLLGSNPNPRLSPSNKKEVPAVNREPSIKADDGVVTKLVSKPNRNKSSNATFEIPVKSSSRKVSSPRVPEPEAMSKVCPLNESRCAGDCQPDPEGSMTRTRSGTPPSRSQWKTISNSYPDDSDDGAMHERASSQSKSQWKEELTSPFPPDFGFNAGSKSLHTTKTENENRNLPLIMADNRYRLESEALRAGVYAARIADYRSATENIGCQSEDQHQNYDTDPPVHTCNNKSFEVCQQCFLSTKNSPMISPLQTPPPRERTRSSPGQDADPSVADPVKRPSPSASQRKVKKRPISSLTRPRPSTRVLNSVTNSKPNKNQAASATSVDTDLPQAGKVSDKAVFRGLHVATAAACDEDLDKWIEDLTGVSARQFLADLSKFDGLGVNALANVARRAAKQRREEVKAWENLRKARQGTRGEEDE